MKQTSKAAIERQREINRQHREIVEDSKKKPKKPIQKLSDEELINRFLKTNKVTVIPTPIDDGGRLVNINS